MKDLDGACQVKKLDFCIFVKINYTFGIFSGHKILHHFNKGIKKENVAKMFISYKYGIFSTN